EVAVQIAILSFNCRLDPTPPYPPLRRGGEQFSPNLKFPPMSQTLTQSIDALYREKFPASAKLYEEAKKLFPDGVTHDGRFLKPFPVYVESAAGSKKYDGD